VATGCYSARVISMVVEHAFKGFGVEETLVPALQLVAGVLGEPRVDLGRQRAEALVLLQ
jgi:hypothetical protein